MTTTRVKAELPENDEDISPAAAPVVAEKNGDNNDNGNDNVGEVDRQLDTNSGGTTTTLSGSDVALNAAAAAAESYIKKEQILDLSRAADDDDDADDGADGIRYIHRPCFRLRLNVSELVLQTNSAVQIMHSVGCASLCVFRQHHSDKMTFDLNIRMQVCGDHAARSSSELKVISQCSLSVEEKICWLLPSEPRPKTNPEDFHRSVEKNSEVVRTPAIVVLSYLSRVEKCTVRFEAPR